MGRPKRRAARSRTAGITQVMRRNIKQKTPARRTMRASVRSGAKHA